MHAVPVDREIAHSSKEFAEQGGAHLHRDVLSDAPVLTAPEEQCASRTAVDVELAGSIELALDRRPRAPQQHDALPGAQLPAADLRVAADDPTQVVGRVIEAHRLSENPWRKLRLRDGARFCSGWRSS